MGISPNANMSMAPVRDMPEVSGKKKNVIKQYQEDNIFLILLTYYIMC